MAIQAVMPERLLAQEIKIPSNDNEEVLYFPVTVDSSFTHELEIMVLRSCGNDLSSLTVERLPKKHLSKIWICIKPPVLGKILHAIICGLPEAELGPIMHVTPSH